jgi:hypothetical protein
LPLLPISYGVFGRFGNYQGFVYTDDEDPDANPNINFITKYIYDDDNYNYNTYYDDYPIPNIINPGLNTRLYISKATQCQY